jgi:hypothetical protein
VRSVLVLHRNVNGGSTQVDIQDGVITLRGAATSEAQKELTTEYAEDVSGVLRVPYQQGRSRQAGAAELSASCRKRAKPLVTITPLDIPQ